MIVTAPNHVHRWQLRVIHRLAVLFWGTHVEPQYSDHYIPGTREKPEAHGYPDYQSMPDEFWRCTNCGRHTSKIRISTPCKLLRAPRYGWRAGLILAGMESDDER